MNRVLVDTSVWVEHFKRPNPVLAGLIRRKLVLSHYLVIGEIACGTPPNRMQTLLDLGELSQASHVSVHEVLAFIDRERLYGLGCGLVDMLLIVSARVTPNTELWTIDRRQAKLAERFGILYRPPEA